jgi:hypothetical protein
MNRLDWAQIVLSLVVMLIGFYIALSRPRGRGVPATTRAVGFGVALLGLSYLVGGFEGSTVEGPPALPFRKEHLPSFLACFPQGPQKLEETSCLPLYLPC